MYEPGNSVPNLNQNSLAPRGPDQLTEEHDREDRVGAPTRHGLRRRSLFVAREDRDAFEAFRVATLQELAPQSQTELFYATQIVTHRWFLLQADQAEAASMRKTFHTELRRKPYEPDSAQNPEADDIRLDSAMARTASTKEVHSILRYRIGHERALERIERMLRLEQKRRQSEEARPSKEFEVLLASLLRRSPQSSTARADLSSELQSLLPNDDQSATDANDRESSD